MGSKKASDWIGLFLLLVGLVVMIIICVMFSIAPSTRSDRDVGRLFGSVFLAGVTAIVGIQMWWRRK